MADRRVELTVAEVAVLAASTLGVDVPNARVRKWIQLGRIRRNACGAVDAESVLLYLERRQVDALDTDDEPA